MTLRVASQAALRGLPLLLGFDPAVVQVVNVGEGEFLKQGNGRTTFTHRIDPQQGKLFVALVRQAASGVEPGVNGSGGVLTVTLRAVKAAASTRLQLLSATPEPAGTATTPLPLDAVLRVVP